MIKNKYKKPRGNNKLIIINKIKTIKKILINRIQIHIKKT